MPRKMILRKDGNQHPLTQVVASNEEELQELVKENPDILPFEEYSLTGPLMVVGRETTLPSGSVDLASSWSHRRQEQHKSPDPSHHL